MKIKKIIHITVLITAVFAVSLFTVKNEQKVLTSAQTDRRPTVILDAGHEALENTIKTPKNHRQANVEIIPKTRLNSGFSPLLDKLICENEINLQIP